MRFMRSLFLRAGEIAKPGWLSRQLPGSVTEREAVSELISALPLASTHNGSGSRSEATYVAWD